MKNNQIILNSKGELITDVAGFDGNPVILNKQETYEALRIHKKFNEEYANALGYEINITTLYGVTKKVSQQKFFEIPPADFVPVRVGENSWTDNILTYRDYAVSGDFEAGVLNTGNSNSRLAESDAAIDSLVNPVVNWGKQVSWSIPELKLASRSNNWNLVAAKEAARKKGWDLGIQKIAFFGSSTIPTVLGLFTQTGVTTNTSLIPTNINAMTATQYSTFVAGLIGTYRANTQYTAMPNLFIIPEQDYDGLCTLVPGTVGTFPVSMLDYLLKAFRDSTGNPNFEIKRCAYADKANNTTVTGLNTNIYTLMNYDMESICMDIPVDYQTTLQNTINGFQFQNVGFGQFTGPLAIRPLEMMYFTHS